MKHREKAAICLFCQSSIRVCAASAREPEDALFRFICDKKGCLELDRAQRAQEMADERAREEKEWCAEEGSGGGRKSAVRRKDREESCRKP